MANVRVEGTDRFQWTNGRKPSGRGYWMFKVGEDTVSMIGLYSEVKAQVVKMARAKGLFCVTLLP